MKKYALISVSDKTGIVEFAKDLTILGYDIISTGGTFKLLKEASIPCTEVSDITKFPEIMDGRVKTLHPTIHAGILALRSNKEHMKHVTHSIDIVCVNLYPFLDTIKKPSATFDIAVENIDIGGPTMLRASAKNYQDVLSVCQPSLYKEVIDRLKSNTVDMKFRRALMAQTFAHTAFYDSVISNYLNQQLSVVFPATLTTPYEKVADMRYGENPHQIAAFYKEPLGSELSIANAKQLNGKELSFNNINDANAAVSCLLEFDECACVAVKHATPCAVAIGKSALQAYTRAHNADPESIFGGIVAINREIDGTTATELAKIFLEVIIAPSYNKEALQILTAKPNLRLLTLPIDNHQLTLDKTNFDKKFVEGGLLLQTADLSKAQIATQAPIDSDLTFAMKVAKHLKSNAIALAKDGQTIGLGGGQTSRVESVRIALRRSGNRVKGSVMASDGFFPFNDSIQMAIDAGVSAIIQPGGSKNDEAALELCKQHKVQMVMTGVRHFKH